MLAMHQQHALPAQAKHAFSSPQHFPAGRTPHPDSLKEGGGNKGKTIAVSKQALAAQAACECPSQKHISKQG